MRFLISSALLVLGTASAAPALAADWRTCTVGGCLIAPCEANEGFMIVSKAINVENPAVGGTDGAVEKMKQYFLAQLNGRVDQGPIGRCSDAQESEQSATEMAVRVYKTLMDQYSRGSIDMATVDQVFAGYDEGAASASEGSSAGTDVASAEPEKVAEASRQTPAKSEGNGDPMNFMMWVDMREPINGGNSVCFSDIKMKPAPEGYRGNWPTLKNALPIIKGYFALMLQECSKHGTPVSQNVGFSTDDVSPADARQRMHETVEHWRKKGFPEVFIPG